MAFRRSQNYAPPTGPPPYFAQVPQHAPPPQPYYQAPPPQHYPQQPPRHHYHHHQQHQPPPQTSYRPRSGFTNLPAHFTVWNSTNGSTTYLQMGLQPGGPVAYSSKVTSGSKTKFKPGVYNDGSPSVGEVRSKHMLSSKSIVAFNGYESTLDGSDGSRSSARWPVDMPVRGRTEPWEWRRIKPSSSMVARLFKSKQLGNWELCPAGSPPGTPPVATWTNNPDGSMFENGVPFGTFQFHGPAAAGALGDGFNSVAIMSMMRILHLFLIEQIASMAGSAAG